MERQRSCAWRGQKRVPGSPFMKVLGTLEAALTGALLALFRPATVGMEQASKGAKDLIATGSCMYLGFVPVTREVQHGSGGIFFLT